MYIKLTNGTPEPYSINQLRSDNPQVSFPAEIPNVLLAEYDVFPIVTITPQPEHAETEVVESAGFAQLEDGSWTQAWTVRPMTAQELEQLARQKDKERRYAYQQEADPLFFKWQRGESTQEAWLAKVEEIKARYPKE